MNQRVLMIPAAVCMIHHNHDSERHESSEQMRSKNNSNRSRAVLCSLSTRRGLYLSDNDLHFYISYLKYSLMDIELKLPPANPRRRTFGGESTRCFCSTSSQTGYIKVW